MLHVRNTSHQDSETTVIKANRKHQIVLNMEVKRIEMEKKMRERYFSFEMSLMKARRFKIIDRQKSLGIYRPQTMEHGRDPRKERRMDSFFFTTSVQLDSKVKLPPVERKRTVPGYPMKLANSEDFLKANKLPKNINRKNLFDGKMLRGLEDGSGKIIKESSNLSERKANNQAKNAKSDKNKEIHRSTEALKKDLNNPKDQLHDKDLQEENADKPSQSEFCEAKEQENEENDSRGNKQTLNSSKENNVTLLNNLKDVAKTQTFSETTGLIQAGLSSLPAHDINEFPSYQELKAWRNSLETRRFDLVKDSKVFDRLKSASATGHGKDIDIDQALTVRPQSALARLSREPVI